MTINIKHGHRSGGKISPTYKSWSAMIDRCKTNHKSHSYYFDKGIEICDRWLVFENFLTDIGIRSEGCSLDRIDNSKDYCKSNCRWSTYKEQAQNRSSTVLTKEIVTEILKLREQGVSLRNISSILKINESTVKNVIYRGDWSNASF